MTDHARPKHKRVQPEPSGRPAGRSATQMPPPSALTPRAIHGGAQPWVGALQRLAGNRATADLIVARDRGTSSTAPVIQRAPDAPTIEAVNIVNKNSTFKLKFDTKPALPGGALEIKKVGLEIDGTSEISAPELTSKGAGVKVSGGGQSTATSATDLKENAAKTTAARVYAADLQARLPGLAQSGVRDALKFKVNGDVTPGKEGKAAVGFAIDTEYISGDVMFNFLKVDLAAKDPKDRFKPLTATVKVATGKLLEKSFPKALRFLGTDMDLKVRIKIGGSIEIGPRWELLESKIVERFGKEVLTSYRAGVIDTIAREESTMLVEHLSEKIARDATKSIADKEVRDLAFAEARQKAIAAANERGIYSTMIKVMEREGGVALAEKTDLTGARMAMRAAAELGAREVFEVLGKTVVKEAVKDALRVLSLRRLGTSLVSALALGPVDVALIGIDLIATSVLEVLRGQQIKEMGMTAQLVRDNYVRGYCDALAGKSDGRGGVSGASSPEGAAFMAGTKDGGSQALASLTAAMAERPELASGELSKEEIRAQVFETLSTMEVSTERIISVATPKLEQMLIDAYVKVNSGWIDKLFGLDVRESKSFEDFLRVIKSNLGPSATHTTVATLSNGVTLTLVSLDYTGDNARQFRTQDGQYVVHLGGDTKAHSGWITEDGTPLEEIYRDQNAADKSSDPETTKRHLDSLKSKLAAGTLNLEGTYNGLSYTFVSASLKEVPDNDGFQQFLRSPDALSLTVDQAGLAAKMKATERFDKEVTDYRDTLELDFTATRASRGTTVEISKPWVLDQFRAGASGSARKEDNDWIARAKADFMRDLAGASLASLPKLY